MTNLFIFKCLEKNAQGKMTSYKNRMLLKSEVPPHTGMYFMFLWHRIEFSIDLKYNNSLSVLNFGFTLESSGEFFLNADALISALPHHHPRF